MCPQDLGEKTLMFCWGSGAQWGFLVSSFLAHGQLSSVLAVSSPPHTQGPGVLLHTYTRARTHTRFLPRKDSSSPHLPPVASCASVTARCPVLGHRQVTVLLPGSSAHASSILKPPMVPGTRAMELPDGLPSGWAPFWISLKISGRCR